jgi:hypothetical protein
MPFERVVRGHTPEWDDAIRREEAEPCRRITCKTVCGIYTFFERSGGVCLLHYFCLVSYFVSYFFLDKKVPKNQGFVRFAR